ncbi:hypothetical protein HYH02_009980 [Chlamydomonas schloesseri]|uniref:MYND-type domain-containing protein n=1 Tax=Chlamydomonas schloesseri TaxID=2026947 RepID=A0A835TC78_9CHLO|nr:hypothetical protein HYH02_009980 [Chlamydomonas schloesseri]|eukprot:KAG2441391.1 hypothetical protein HYH02_009980 [Chlamydomonas schloesseri]
MLKPIAEGRWNKESAYSGLAKFLKATYLAQGYPEMPTDLVASLGQLMKEVQARMEWVAVGGRRVQADTGPPCHHVIRVATNCVTMLLAVNFSASAGSRTALTRAQDMELIASIELMASRVLDKLGGPLLHEGSFSADDMAGLQLLHEASAESGARLNDTLAALPLHVSASMSLMVLHGLSLRAIKWTLNYVLVRCAKERCDSCMVAGDHAGARAAAAQWLQVARRLAELAPPPPKATSKAAASGTKQPQGRPGVGEQEEEVDASAVSGPQPSALATFMVAEARVSVEGVNPRTLAAMHGAVKAAQEQGDDVVGWLAALNEAQLLVWGAERLDGTFSEDSVQEALDIAAEQRASCRRWGGEPFTESRCRAVLDDVKKELRHSHEWAEKIRQREQEASGRSGGAGGGAGANRSQPPLLPQGRLPVRPRGGDGWQTLQPVALAHHVCAACGKMFHKTQLCARCKSVRYCGRDCQAADWKEHKLECAKLAAAAKQAAAGGESAAAAAGDTDT